MQQLTGHYVAKEKVFLSGLAVKEPIKHRWMEPWYLSYALLGCTMGGMFPILMPLLALKRFNSACHVGFVMAVFNLGGLIAPFLGRVADRYGIHRGLLIGGLIITAATLVAFGFTNSFPVWLGLALLQGIGVFLAMTIGNLFIVEIHPKTEWDRRISRLQTFNSGGQVSGMLLAAALSSLDLSSSLLIAASLIAIAVLPGFLTPKIKNPSAGDRPSHVCQDCRCREHPEPSDLQFLGPVRNLMRHFNAIRHTAFEHMMGVWFACVAGVSAIYTLYPVMMQEMFGIGRDLIGLSFAVAMGLSVFLYTQAGRWTHQFGPIHVLKRFMGMRLTAFIVFFLLEVLTFGGRVYLILMTFMCVVLCWPFIMVSATALAAALAPCGEGEGMGIFCAVFATACLTGSALGGWLATQWGYHAVVAMAVSTEAVGLALTCKTRCAQ
jgi:MFS family permease